MRKGDRVLITLGGETVEGEVILASPNEDSLALAFDGALASRGPSGGMAVFPGLLPVLRDKAGIYRELVHGDEVKLELQRSNL